MNALWKINIDGLSQIELQIIGHHFVNNSNKLMGNMPKGIVVRSSPGGVGGPPSFTILNLHEMKALIQL